jgi:Demerecviridae HNH endonuclease
MEHVIPTAARTLDMGDGLVLELFPAEEAQGANRLAPDDAPAAPLKKPLPVRKLTARRVRELLDCDPEAGTLIWRLRPAGPRQWNTRYAGKPAGTRISNDGYALIRIDSRNYLTHRIVFLHTKGYWPPAMLDHHDGDRQNRAIGNLRPATVEQNNANLPRSSKKGFPRGCWQDPKSGRWQVHIQANKKRVCVGWFDEREVAARAYLDAAELLHGQFSVAERPKLVEAGSGEAVAA